MPDLLPVVPAGPIYARGRVAPHPHVLEEMKRRKRGLWPAVVRTPPATWDSRTQGWIGAVKDQKSCGSCWCFSGTGIVEIAANVDGIGGGSDKFVLSEQYTLDCGKNGGCGGDDNTTVLDWAQKTGLPLSADYGVYEASSNKCSVKQGVQLYKIQEWGFVDGGQGQGITPVPLIQAAIMARGAVGCAVAAGSSWDGYQAGTVHTGNSTGIDHDVILVGWSTTGTKTTATISDGNFSVTASAGWWWMRNSWSETWGEGGYMRIAYGADSIGTEAVWCTFGPPPPPQPIPWLI